MPENKAGSILLVDDDPVIRGMLEIELEDTYAVSTASDAKAAFAILKQQAFDLVISDINMPGMKGYDLLAEVRVNYPKTKIALITGYDIDGYMRMAKQHNISNIIPKTMPFNFDEFQSIVSGLISENIFGLDRYLGEGAKICSQYVVKSVPQIGDVQNAVLKDIAVFHKPDLFVRILLEELITNAVYHAPVDDSGNKKYAKLSAVTLEDHEVVTVMVGSDKEKYGIAVKDTSGKLTKEQVLFWLDRHIHGEGILDEHGRGLHMSRMYADRLIINIKKDTATEVIVLNYFDEKYKGYKPLYINEI
jgi:CheY-like chemotaxis protein